MNLHHLQVAIHLLQRSKSYIQSLHDILGIFSLEVYMAYLFL